jgi:hypothetical protein
MGVVGFGCQCQLSVVSGDAFGFFSEAGKSGGLRYWFWLQTQCERRRNVDLSLFNRACSVPSDASFVLGPPPIALNQGPTTGTSTITITILRLPKKLCDKSLFFQELADRGVDPVATEIIQTHVLHHFAAVITGGANRE